MSRLTTLAIVAALGLYLVHGPRAAAVSPSPDWTGLFASTRVGQALPVLSSAEAALDPAGGRGDVPSEANRSASPSAHSTVGTAADRDEADYKTRREECEWLPGDARNHCIEYVKLRFGRS